MPGIVPQDDLPDMGQAPQTVPEQDIPTTPPHIQNFSKPQDVNLINKSASNFGEMALNIPASAGRVALGTIEPFLHPIMTAKSLYGLSAGIVQTMLGQDTPNTQLVAHVVDSIKEKYGSEEGLRKSLINNPVETAMDLSSVLYPIGWVARGNGLNNLANSVDKLADAANPITHAVSGINKVGSTAIPEKIPQSLYGQAIKPPTKLSPQERLSVIQTGLDKGIMPTAEGYNKLQSMIDSKNKEIADVINLASKNGLTIKTKDVLDKLNDLKVEYGNLPGDWGREGLAAIDNIEQDFRQTHGVDITVDNAQAIKASLYKSLRKMYGSRKNAEIEAYKALAWGLKEEIYKKYPELKTLNAEDSAMILLNEQIEKATGRISNRDFLGSFPHTLTAGGMVDVASGGSGKALLVGALAGIMNAPKIKAATAIALARARSAKLAQPSTTTKRSAALLYQLDQANEEQQ